MCVCDFCSFRGYSKHDKRGNSILFGNINRSTFGVLFVRALYIITKTMRALWLVNQLWVIAPVNPRKNRVSSELLYKRNRPQVLYGLSADKLLAILVEQSKNSAARGLQILLVCYQHPAWFISFYIITKSMRALWLVNQLWVIVLVNPRKNRASSELLYKSNRPQVSMGYKLINHLECW